ncbi:MAG: cytochrome P450, partial [Alphaproteobacteria bacterium]|nr:cytochrome P450 [Alphaproteobacteria bacterium]
MTVQSIQNQFQQFSDTRRARDFIPPMPARLPEGTPIWTKLLKSRDNLIAGWTTDCFERKVFDFAIFNQRYIVCNDSASVRQVFLEKHDNYDRKSPQMRRALEPLLGDGLFVSDGALWRQRRDACAPSLRSEHLPDYIVQMVDTSLEMADSWARREGQKIDVLEEMAHLTARIIGRTIFGDDTPEDEARQVVAGFTKYIRSIEQLDLASSLGMPALKYVTNPFGALSGRRSARTIHEVIDRIIARHRVSGGGDTRRTNLLAHFLSPIDEAGGEAG